MVQVLTIDTGTDVTIISSPYNLASCDDQILSTLYRGNFSWTLSSHNHENFFWAPFIKRKTLWVKP